MTTLGYECYDDIWVIWRILSNGKNQFLEITSAPIGVWKWNFPPTRHYRQTPDTNEGLLEVSLPITVMDVQRYSCYLSGHCIEKQKVIKL